MGTRRKDTAQAKPQPNDAHGEGSLRHSRSGKFPHPHQRAFNGCGGGMHAVGEKWRKSPGESQMGT